MFGKTFKPVAKAPEDAKRPPAASAAAARPASPPAEAATLSAVRFPDDKAAILDTEDALGKIPPIKSILYDELRLSASLRMHLAPVSFDSSKKRCALLVAPAYQKSDVIAEVVALMTRNGYELCSGVNAYLVNPQILLSLSRGNITVDALQKRRMISGDKRQQELWHGFVDIISWAHERKAADAHYIIQMNQPRSSVKFTIDGKYVSPSRFVLPTDLLLDQLGLAWQRSGGGNGAIFDPRIEQDCQVFLITTAGRRVMLRFSSYISDDGPAVTLRILDLDVEMQHQSVRELGYLPDHVEMIDRVMRSEGGAILFSGVMASGKSTTQATIANNLPPTVKLVTLEAPVEYRIRNAIQASVVLGSGEDSRELSNKLRAIKRSGGHWFLLGEIRDQQTGSAYQDITQSGLNLLTTTHAGRAITIPDRLASPFIGVDRDVLSTPGNMKLLISQALIPLNCPSCKKPFTSLIDDAPTEASRQYWRNYRDRLRSLYDVDTDKITVKNEKGCEMCRREEMPELNGLRGRTVVAEMIEPDDIFLRLVKDARALEAQVYYAWLRNGARFDSESMVGKSAMECAVYKMSRGEIDPREIEPKFHTFETEEIKRGRRERSRDLPKELQSLGF